MQEHEGCFPSFNHHETVTVCVSLGVVPPVSKTRTCRLFTTAPDGTLKLPSTRWKNLKLTWYSFALRPASGGTITTNLRSFCSTFSTSCTLPWNSFARCPVC